MNRRQTLSILGRSSLAAWMPLSVNVRRRRSIISLADVRAQSYDYFDTIRRPGESYGAYRAKADHAVDLYASCDVAIARHVMGEELTQTLTAVQRKAWVDYINRFQQPADGCYTDRYGHSKLHANGMTIGALGVLGGKQQYPVRLYEAFDTVEKVKPWLEQINWEKQWGASHRFWGGIHCYSLSSACGETWRDRVFAWLNSNLDEQSGWWRKHTVYTDRHQPLGGSVHILPLYQHHRRPFPYPERVIDSVLSLQLPNGRWLARAKDQAHVMHYLELDALYALHCMSELAPGYRRDDILSAVHRYADRVYVYWNDTSNQWKARHPHRVLSMVSTFGLLQKLLPERFPDSVAWTDIFSDIRLYNTAEVEAT